MFCSVSFSSLLVSSKNNRTCWCSSSDLKNAIRICSAQSSSSSSLLGPLSNNKTHSLMKSYIIHPNRSGFDHKSYFTLSDAGQSNHQPLNNSVALPTCCFLDQDGAPRWVPLSHSGPWTQTDVCKNRRAKQYKEFINMPLDQENSLSSPSAQSGPIKKKKIWTSAHLQLNPSVKVFKNLFPH